MAKLSYVKLPKSPLELSRSELANYLDGVNWAVLLRSILAYEIERVRAMREADEPPAARTLRSLWYTLIKPSLDRLGALSPSYFTAARVRKPKDIGKVPDWDGLASKYLAELVEAGVTSYEELSIIDGSRQRRPPQGINLTALSFSTIGVHYPNLLLFTEKDTIYTVIENIASLYGISVLSGGGQPSFAATENLIREMVAHENFTTGSKIIILTLTDYDPAGYTISQSVVDQVAKVAANLPQVGGVSYQRLGLEPAQLTPEEIERNTYTPAPTGLPQWFKQTGGVNGQPLGLELDALPIDRIVGLFVDGLESLIDESIYTPDLGESLINLLIWETIKPQVEIMRKELWDGIEADGIIRDLYLPPHTLSLFARAGVGYIHPLEYDQYVFKAANDIRAKLQQVANGG